VNERINKRTNYEHLGFIDYKQAWDYQTRLFQENLDIKAFNRTAPAAEQQLSRNHLLFCEHPHVYTLGKSGKEENLLITPEQLAEAGATFYRINRGGDITYHGPGQIVVYPIIDLENFFTDIHRYMRTLEESVIRTCAHYDLKAGRIEGLTGVWIDFDHPETARKICALGVKTSRWVTMHGLAFNVNTSLNYFDHIIPCGIDDKAVTSLERELGFKQDMGQVEEKLKEEIVKLFDFELV
jgi:lipoyl(octanoyl) transferase